MREGDAKLQALVFVGDIHADIRMCMDHEVCELGDVCSQMLCIWLGQGTYDRLVCVGGRQWQNRSALGRST